MTEESCKKEEPKSHDHLEWMALMRHYGAPSRLLDCTYSFYIAAYFALRYAKGDSTVWVIDAQWLKDRARVILEKQYIDFHNPQTFCESFLRIYNPVPFVAPVNPLRLNERLTNQQGLFLCPGDIGKLFMENLYCTSNDTNEIRNRVIKVVLPKDLRKDAMQELHRMNVTSASLFLGLGGFAESLNDWFYLEREYEGRELKEAIRCILTKRQS